MITKKRTSFTKLFQLWGIIFLIGFGGSIVGIDIARSYRYFDLRADQMRSDYTSKQKEIVKQEVMYVVDLIHSEKVQAKISTITKIKSRVDEACAIAQQIYRENKSTRSKDEIQKMIIDAISAIRFERGKGYYFITRLDGQAVLFPSKPELEGKNLIDTQDTHGQHLIGNMIGIVKQSGEGFYRYDWTKPNAQGNDYEKIAFIKGLGIYDWIIGTGLYIDDVEEQIKTDLLLRISRIRFGEEGYIFVNRFNGDSLVANGKLVSGTKKLWEIFNKNPEKTKNIFEKEYNAALKPEGDYIYYSLIKLSDPAKESPKTSFIYGIPQWQWIVGAGVYLDDVETVIARMQTELNDQVKRTMLFFSLIAVGIIAFFLFLFNRLNRRLKNDFKLFISFFNRAALSDEPIDRSLVQFNEIDRIAENANKMLEDRKQAEKALRASEERYSAIFHEACDGIVLIEAENGSIADCNPRFEEMTGRSLSELRKMKIWNVSPPGKVEGAREKFQENLLNAGATTYQYDVDGFLTDKIQGLDTTEYVYSSRGELLHVDLPNGTVIEYVHDPLGRRIAKKVDGIIEEKYLWQGLTRLLAVYDGSDALVMRFEYADARMPVAMTRGGSTYYLAYDQVGSLRVVADTSGNVVKRIEYDSFGNVIGDTNPAFDVPFGFAGGLHDRDTGLVRFGYRDYDPDVGRWTAKDPIGFAGGDTDLYGYCLNDPVNWIDLDGLLKVNLLMEDRLEDHVKKLPRKLRRKLRKPARMIDNLFHHETLMCIPGTATLKPKGGGFAPPPQFFTPPNGFEAIYRLDF